MAPRVFRLFISSPADVKPERERVRVAVDRLNGEFEGLARIEVLAWEDAFYTAATSFQEAIDAAVGGMSGTDMVVCIVWSRVGLKLNPAVWRRSDGSAYESGTVLEFETAVAVSREHSGAPDVFLFRKSAEVLYHADRYAEEAEQHQLLAAVWKRWTATNEGYNIAGYQTFDAPDDFEQKLEACLRQWLERKGIIVKGPVWDRIQKGSPFCGLAPFEASHTLMFFGREAVINHAIANLRRAPFLLLIGASGAGKSSLMRAGLVPRICRPGVNPEVDLWRQAIMVAGANPLTSLAEAVWSDAALGKELRGGDFRTPQLLTNLFSAGGDASMAPIHAAIERAARDRAARLRYHEPRPGRLLLAIDQLERLFVEAQPQQVEAFANLLSALIDHELAVVVATMRSDAYGLFQQVASFVALRERGIIQDVLPPTRQELQDIVTRPVAACHPPLAFETDTSGRRTLADKLVADAKGGDALPILELTLERLFEAEAKRGDGVLRFADYPGMDVAVTGAANEAFATLEEKGRAELVPLIIALVRDVDAAASLGKAPLTIVPVKRVEFERERPARTALINAFIACRLLTTEETDDTVQVRPVHEALLRAWPQAADIITQNAALIRVRHTLEPMVAEWSRATGNARRDHLVTSPALLAGSSQLLEQFGEDLPADMRTFIADSLAADARRRDAERRRQRHILAATAAGLVIALILAGLAGWQWRAAAQQRAIAEAQRDRAEKTLTLAADITNKLVFDLASDFRDLVGVPLEAVRKVLEAAVALQSQLSQSGETAPILRYNLAMALGELAVTLQDKGDNEGAEAAATREIEIFAELTANSAEPQWRAGLGLGYWGLGQIYLHEKKYDPALENFNKALAVLSSLLAAEPDNRVWQRYVEAAEGRSGDALMSLNRHADAQEAYLRALSIAEKLAAAVSDDLDYQDDLALLYGKLAGVYGTGGDLEGALGLLRKSLAIDEKLAAAEPDKVKWQYDAMRNYEMIAFLVTDMNQKPEAIGSLRKALLIAERLAAGNPDQINFQTYLVEILYELATLGDDTKTRLQRALSVLNQLQAKRQLSKDEIDWLVQIQEALADLEK